MFLFFSQFVMIADKEENKLESNEKKTHFFK